MKRKKWWHTIKKIALWVIMILVLLLAGIALYNRTLPTASPVIENLSEDEQIRLRETTHLRNTIGNQVWPGWAGLEIPLLVYNERYAFLMGISDPDSGWVRVPFGSLEGGPWHPVPGGGYFRQPLPESGATPQAFIVRIGDHFAASMTTLDWTGIKLVAMMREQLPGFIVPIMPYALFLAQFGSDWHVSALLHESFHVVQARQAYDRLVDAEEAVSYEGRYPWDDTSFREQWLNERRLLARALGSTEGDRERLLELVSEWWAVRQERQRTIPGEAVDYERKREWLEGLAKYAELRIWLLANASDAYAPLPGMEQVEDFNAYREAREHRNREIDQLESDLQFGETIFYYSGWAQAALLDRLATPDWKEKIMEEGVYLDQLLAEAISEE